MRLNQSLFAVDANYYSVLSTMEMYKLKSVVLVWLQQELFQLFDDNCSLAMIDDLEKLLN
jgi:hypothetical protein